MGKFEEDKQEILNNVGTAGVRIMGQIIRCERKTRQQRTTELSLVQMRAFARALEAFESSMMNDDRPKIICSLVSA